MRRLDVSVLLRLANGDSMAFDTIVTQEITILRGELFVTGEVLHGGRQAVTANTARNSTRVMKAILQSCGERLEGLRMTEVNILPIRVGKDRMEHHVLKSLLPDRNVQLIHDDEVECDHVARMMLLGKNDFLLDTMLQLPLLDTPFESATNRVSDTNVTFRTVGRVVFLLEPIENCVRFQS
jgi:hypothetical protein